jgi:PAS domain S-box-containing protein
VALGVRFAVNPWLGSYTPYPTLVAAVAITVWLAGFGPAILAAAICIPAALMFAIPYHSPEGGIWLAHGIAVTLYTVAMVIMAFLGKITRQAWRRAQTAAAEARSRQQELRHEIEERHKAVEEVLRAKLEWERTFNSVPDLIAILGNDHRVVRVNLAMAKRLGLTPDQCVGLTCYQAVHGSNAPPVNCPHRLTLADGKEHTAEIHDDRMGGDFLVTTTPLYDAQGQIEGTVHVARDITDRKRAEESLRLSEQRLQGTFDNAGMGIMEVDAQIRVIAANDTACEILGYRREDLLGKTIHELTAPEDREKSDGLNAQFVQGRLPRLDYQKRYLRRDGAPVWVHVTVTAVRDSGGRFVRAIGTLEDISERLQAEDVLRESEQRYRQLFANMVDGLAHCEMIFDEQGKPQDFIYLEVNDSFENLTGLIGVEGKRVSEVIPGIRESNPELFEIYGRVATTGKPETLITEVKPLGIWFNISVYSSQKGHFVASFNNITGLHKAQEELRRSNEDLEQFAYVASHDLKEPLRMVSGHLQIIQDRLKDKLDDRTQQSMLFAVDGANRMQELIRDLLAFSRAGRKTQGFLPTDMEKVLSTATANLSAAIAEAGATVEHDPLPTVQAEPPQMMQLLQNLIANAVKYRVKDRKPQIRIAACREKQGWLFSVRDNGIGIDPKNSDRVFEIFQRLHTRQEYSGTGIGLAVCKRIVEYHCGRIWVESVPGEGSTFFFTIPDRPQGQQFNDLIPTKAA